MTWKGWRTVGRYTLVPLFTWLYGPVPVSHLVHLSLSVDAPKQLSYVFIVCAQLRRICQMLIGLYAYFVYCLLRKGLITYVCRGSIALKRPAFFTCLPVTYGLNQNPKWWWLRTFNEGVSRDSQDLMRTALDYLPYSVYKLGPVVTRFITVFSADSLRATQHVVSSVES